MIPKPIIYLALFLVVLALMPPAIIAWARSTNSRKPRVHIVPDMDNQAKFRAQHGSILFADGRAMRPTVEGTVARGHAVMDSHFENGVINGQWATEFPTHVDGIEVNRAFIDRGRERFDIFCTPCHGYGGYGDGIVHVRANELMLSATNGSTWVAPKSLHDPEVRDQAVGRIYNSITNGIRNMPSYATQVPDVDRWAIVAYIRALQRSQNANPEDIPASIRQDLPLIELPPAPAAEESQS